MGISPKVICCVCSAVILAELFGEHQQAHTHVHEPMFPHNPWGAQNFISGTATTTSTSSSR